MRAGCFAEGAAVPHCDEKIEHSLFKERGIALLEALKQLLSDHLFIALLSGLDEFKRCERRDFFWQQGLVDLGHDWVWCEERVVLAAFHFPLKVTEPDSIWVALEQIPPDVSNHPVSSFRRLDRTSLVQVGDRPVTAVEVHGLSGGNGLSALLIRQPEYNRGGLDDLSSLLDATVCKDLKHGDEVIVKRGDLGSGHLDFSLLEVG